jgi:hypothetical protein
MTASRIILILLTGACMIAIPCFAQEATHTVYLNDGSLIVGTLIELKPNESVTIRAVDGIVHLIRWDRVQRVERNLAERAAVAQSANGAVESWYMYWGLGYASPSYPSGMQALIDGVKAEDGLVHTPLSLDMFGFYWPIAARTTIAGIVVGGVADRYDYEGGSVQLNQLLISGSVMHFFGEVPGDGVFLRGDAGYAVLSQIMPGWNPEDKNGIGFHAGAGYGIPVSDETRILLHGGYTYRAISGDGYDTFSMNVGVLF